jgi:hypothetical protein
VGNGLYLVGERGPELLAMNQGSSGYVYNNSQTRSLMGMATPRANGGPVGGMALSPDTYLSKSISGMTEIIRSLGGGYSVGVEGKSDTEPKPFTQDQNTTGSEKHYDAATMAQHMAEAYKSMTGSAHGSGEQGYLELVKTMQEQTKEMKKLFGKIASSNGYF